MAMTEAFGFTIANTGHYPVIAGHDYLMQLAFLTGTISRTCEVYFQWYTAAGGVISTSSHATGPDNSSSWANLSLKALAPSGAASVQIFVVVDGAVPGEIHYLASNFLWDLSLVPDWTGFLDFVELSNTVALDGNFSMATAVTSIHIPVVPYQEYLATAWFRADAAALPQICSVLINWFDSGSNLILSTPCNMPVTDSVAAFAIGGCSGMAPGNAATATIILEPHDTLLNEIHYADRVYFGTQPYQGIPVVEYGAGELQGVPYAVTTGRPSLAGRMLYTPIATIFSGAEQAAYNAGGYVPAPKPQFLARIDLSQVLDPFVP